MLGWCIAEAAVAEQVRLQQQAAAATSAYAVYLVQLPQRLPINQAMAPRYHCRNCGAPWERICSYCKTVSA